MADQVVDARHDALAVKDIPERFDKADANKRFDKPMADANTCTMKSKRMMADKPALACEKEVLANPELAYEIMVY